MPSGPTCSPAAAARPRRSSPAMRRWRAPITAQSANSCGASAIGSRSRMRGTAREASTMRRLFVFLVGAGCAIAPLALVAQQPQGPAVVSPDVQADRRVTFRILAPNAQKVELRTPGDIPGIGGRGGTPLQFTKSSEGVWESTTNAIPAGAYRYVFAV